MKYAALFGGAGRNQTSREYIETVAIGKYLVERGYVVKNGGYGGMMEAVAKGATDAGGTAIGYTCKMVGGERGNDYLTETIVTDTLYQRLEKLIDGTTLFIVQRGGVGTLSEVFLTLDILRKEGAGSQPRLFFVGDVYYPFVEELKTSLIPPHEHYLFSVVRNAKELIALLDQLADPD